MKSKSPAIISLALTIGISFALPSMAFESNSSDSRDSHDDAMSPHYQGEFCWRWHNIGGEMGSMRIGVLKFGQEHYMLNGLITENSEEGEEFFAVNGNAERINHELILNLTSSGHVVNFKTPEGPTVTVAGSVLFSGKLDARTLDGKFESAGFLADSIGLKAWTTLTYGGTTTLEHVQCAGSSI